MVSLSSAGDRLLLGEAKWSARSFSRSMLDRETRRLAAKEPPDLRNDTSNVETIRVLFVPTLAEGAPRLLNGVRVMDAAAVMT